MTRALACVVVAVALAPAVEAGVKTEEKTLVRFGGPLGGILNKFGGKAAKDGVVQTVAVVGDRKLTVSDERGEIVDLAEEKIYDLDVKKRTYAVTTFAELRKRIEEQRAKAEKEAAEARKEQEKKKEGDRSAAPAAEMEVEVEVSETGRKRPIAGHEARQVTVKAWVHEKGKKIQQSGGLLVTTDTWLGPRVDALGEVEKFDRRYALKMAEIMGFTAPGAAASPGQMAALTAMYPGLLKAMERIQAETRKADLSGTALANGLTVTLWKSAAQVAESQRQSEGGGLSGPLAKKLMKKGDPSDPRTEVLSSTSEMLKITPNATAADVALPDGYKLK
ncbi:MAG TPA: hypothetical protein VLF95_05090 [Vicinamibacteria bacterium]|nr:hypothetical protein [Vicinamibacteria bacterium]